MSDFSKLIKGMGIWRKYLFLLLLRAPFDAARTWMLANLLRTVFMVLENSSAFSSLPQANLAIERSSIFCLETDGIGLLPGTCVVYGLVCAVLFLYNGVVWSNYAAFAAKTEVQLQKKMFDKILDLPLKRVDNRLSGEWITRLNSDIQATFTMMNGPLNIPHLTVAVINTMLSSFLLLRSSGLFLGVTWAFLSLQLFMNYQIVLKAVPKLKEEAQNVMAENTSAIKPLITEADMILVYDAGEMMMKNCEEKSRKLMKINRKIHVRNALSDMGMRLFGIGGYLVILLAGYGFISDGAMAFSDVVYCFQVRGSVMAGAFMFVTCINHLKMNAVCVQRVCDTMSVSEKNMLAYSASDEWRS